MTTHIIQRLRQNAVSLMSRDQTVKQLADIVAELCLVCEDQAKTISKMQERIDSQQPEAASSE